MLFFGTLNSGMRRRRGCETVNGRARDRGRGGGGTGGGTLHGFWEREMVVDMNKKKEYRRGNE